MALHDLIDVLRLVNEESTSVIAFDFNSEIVVNVSQLNDLEILLQCSYQLLVELSREFAKYREKLGIPSILV